jgi:hypothetical protein
VDGMARHVRGALRVRHRAGAGVRLAAGARASTASGADGEA